MSMKITNIEYKDGSERGRGKGGKDGAYSIV